MKDKRKHIPLPEATEEYRPPVFNPKDYYADALAGKERIQDAIALRGFRTFLDGLEPDHLRLDDNAPAELLGSIQLWGNSVWDFFYPLTRDMEKEEAFASVEVGDRLDLAFDRDRFGGLDLAFLDATAYRLDLEPYFDYTRLFLEGEVEELHPNERLYCTVTSCACYKGAPEPDKPNRRRRIYVFGADLYRERYDE